MTDKKHIPKKEMVKLITEGIENGETKNEVFDRLSSEYHDSTLIAKFIAFFPDKELKEKYKQWNQVLFILLVITSLLKVVGVLPLLLELPALGVLLLLVVPILNIWYAIELRKTRAYIYPSLGLLAIAAIFKSLREVDETGVWGVIDMVLLGILSGLSFFIGKKMFPNFRFYGPKKDASGNWIL